MPIPKILGIDDLKIPERFQCIIILAFLFKKVIILFNGRGKENFLIPKTFFYFPRSKKREENMEVISCCERKLSYRYQN